MADEIEQSHIVVVMKKYDPEHWLPGQIKHILVDGKEIRCKSIGLEIGANDVGTFTLTVHLSRVEFKIEDE